MLVIETWSLTRPCQSPRFNHHASELTQESHVILHEQPNVINPILPHRDALDAKTKRPACVFFRVDLARGQHIRVHHPTSAKFDPAFFILEIDIHFGTRLSERKEAGPKPHF